MNPLGTSPAACTDRAAVPAGAGRLRIALLTYRGKPTCGGQGVYIRHLSRALVDLGHHVEVFSGPPLPELDPRVGLHAVPSLDFYNDEHPLQMPRPAQMRTRGDWIEFGTFLTGVFPEPLAFSVRVAALLRDRVGEFDIVHDNQGLGSGMLTLGRAGLPLIATIHHPNTVDRRLELEAAERFWPRFFRRRWYSFVDMQTRVVQSYPEVITDSEASLEDITRDHRVARERLFVVPVGVDAEVFRPLPGVARRPGRLMTLASADMAMKGLRFLLEAVAALRTAGRRIELVVVGRLKEDSAAARTVRELGLADVVRFEADIPEARLVELYAEAELAIVPSLYEGFSLPAVEAMSAGVPRVATTGGALPEVVGRDGQTALLVPPGDSSALARRIAEALDNPELRAHIAAAGRQRVLELWTWKQTALKTVERYRSVLSARRNGVELRRGTPHEVADDARGTSQLHRPARLRDGQAQETPR